MLEAAQLNVIVRSSNKSEPATNLQNLYVLAIEVNQLIINYTTKLNYV